ncbi:MAG: hypothetical protein H0V27_01660 [Pyrinomonadaceae bacterium]|jgi:uncharacterized protein (DUF427 family)|nr:hypothetical protein [Pyrinomonadaceae bacterium]
MASRVAVELENEAGIEVEKVKGGFGEFSVSIDGRKVVDTNRFWYPNPTKIVNQIRAHLAA